MKLDVLQELGLTKSEIAVYLSLLETGQSTTGPIVEKARISSSKIYEILEKLIDKGLVSFVLKGSIKYFEATQPERILDLLKEKEKKLEEQRKEVEKILPELTRKKNLSNVKDSAAVYRGMKGLETVFYEGLDLLKKGDMFYAFGIPHRTNVINRFFVRWSKDRAEKGINSQLLFNDEARGELQTLPENNRRSEVKFMEKGVVTPAAINIFKHRTVIFPNQLDQNPLLIVIDNQNIADSFKAQFELLWNQNVTSFTGVEGPRYVLNDIMNTKYDENLAFGLSEDKLNKYASKELAKLVSLQNEGKINPPRLLFTGEIVREEISKVAKWRVLPKEFSSPFHYEVYGDKVAIINWDAPITTIIVKNKEMVNSFKAYFDSLWKVAKEKK